MAAVRIAQADGLAAVSMSRVAAEVDATAMARQRPGHVPTAPPEQLGSPRQIDIFTVCEEGFVEELAVEGRVLEHPRDKTVFRAWSLRT